MLMQDTKEKVNIYASGKNTEERIKVIEGEYGISSIYFQEKKGTPWMKTEILSIDTIQEYLKVKIVETNEVFELFIEWNTKKMKTIDEQQQTVIYWLEKS